jgi:hypothetical protein
VIGEPRLPIWGEIMDESKLVSTELYRNRGGGSQERFTLDQIKAALDATADNVTEAALRLGCTCDTVYKYIERHPELQAHRKSIVATMNDYAESTVKQRSTRVSGRRPRRGWRTTIRFMAASKPLSTPGPLRCRRA